MGSSLEVSDDQDGLRKISSKSKKTPCLLRHCVDLGGRRIIKKFLKQHYLLTEVANTSLTQVACSADSFITGSDQGGVVWEWEVSAIMDYHHHDYHECHQPDNKSTI